MKTKYDDKTAIDILNEAFEVISDGKDEISEEKSILFDKKTNQYSVKIPKSLALKAKMNPNSKVKIIVNPTQSTLIGAASSKMWIILKESDHGKKGT